MSAERKFTSHLAHLSKYRFWVIYDKTINVLPG